MISIKKILKILLVFYLLRFVWRYYLLIRPKIRNFFFNFVLKNKVTVKVFHKSQKKIFTMRGYTGSTGDRAHHFYGMEKETPKWIDGFLPNSNLLDIGANVGSYSLYACCLGHNVVSVEPESLNFALLNLNISDNNYNTKMMSYPISCSNKDGLGILNLSGLDWGISSHTFGRETRYDGKKFSPFYKQGSVSFTCNTFLNIINFKPDYIKIDVDGNELLVIQGLVEYLNKNFVREIFIEINEKNIEHSSIKNILSELNFKVTNIFEHAEDNNYLFKNKELI